MNSPAATPPDNRFRHANLSGIARLAMLLDAHTPQDGSFALSIPGAHAIRASHASPEHIHGLHRPALCIVAQGAKSVMLGEAVYDYDASRMLIFSLDLPITARIRQASPALPYLCFRLDIEPAKVAELAMKVYPKGVPRIADSRAIFMAQANESVIDAVARLLELTAQNDEASLIAPLIIEEIFIRLLRSSVGGRLAQVGHADSNTHRIHQAVSWIRNNFSQAMRGEELAELVHMSPSSLHQHFKAITSMSPLQYQKVLRLQEARRLMISSGMDAGVASQMVGYLSPSQFSREYARHFGRAPSKDIARLRNVDLKEVNFAR